MERSTARPRGISTLISPLYPLMFLHRRFLWKSSPQSWLEDMGQSHHQYLRKTPFLIAQDRVKRCKQWVQSSRQTISHPLDTCNVPDPRVIAYLSPLIRLKQDAEARRLYSESQERVKTETPVTFLEADLVVAHIGWCGYSQSPVFSRQVGYMDRMVKCWSCHFFSSIILKNVGHHFLYLVRDC